MQPRRRKYVRASAERESKHFLKIILPSPIHGNQMRIPEEFIKRYGDELSTVATITVPDGLDWRMRLKKCGKHAFFCSKWREFVKYYSLSYGYHLVFSYEGNSKFRVLIFDITSAEICYPCKTRDTSGEPNLNNRKRSKVDDQHYQTRKKKHRIDTIDAHDVNLKSQSKPRKEECSETHSSWEIAKDAANRFKPENPYVTSTIKPSRLYVRSKFAGKYLKPNVGMMLQNCNGEQWDVSCTCHCSSRAMVIVRGWSKFVRDNHLSEGDPCVLELIKRNPVVLKFTVLSAAAPQVTSALN